MRNFVLCLLFVALAAIVRDSFALNCAPYLTTTKTACLAKQAVCASQGVILKWVTQGCREWDMLFLLFVFWLTFCKIFRVATWQVMAAANATNTVATVVHRHVVETVSAIGINRRESATTKRRTNRDFRSPFARRRRRLPPAPPNFQHLRQRSNQPRHQLICLPPIQQGYPPSSWTSAG